MADRDAATLRVIEELKRIYKTKILPLEQLYKFDVFYSPPLSDAEFDSKPQVMLIGQYSVGKTSFIRYLIGKDFPGQRIGPEPTTDRFVAVMDGPDERVIPGNALAVSNDTPYRGLEKFGVSFLNRFEGSQVPCKFLRNVTLIDTPGVLSGEKQRVARGYDFTSVCSWFAQRSDLILILFDAHKLDISDEFRAVIESLKGNEDKIRCVLNKADQVDRQRLMRVYGALMWSLGRVMATPEVLRVYVGSFWDQPLVCTDNAPLFEVEQADLMRDLKDLPRNSAVRKINELVKRVRMGRVHAYIIGYLRDQMPMFMGKEKKQTKLIDDMPMVFRTILKRYNLAPGDFPDIRDFQAKLREQDFTKFNTLRVPLIESIDSVLATDIPRLMEALPRSIIPSDDAISFSNSYVGHEKVMFEAKENPFGEENPFGDNDWALAEYIPLYQEQFQTSQKDGFISGGAAKEVLTKTGLEMGVLRKVWELADVTKDGKLDLHEFVIAMFLADKVKEGFDMPDKLDPEMMPPK